MGTKHPALDARKALIDLIVGMAVTFVLLLLNLSINFIGVVNSYFSAVSRENLIQTLVNILTVWLALLLAVAFYRWIKASRRHGCAADQHIDLILRELEIKN